MGIDREEDIKRLPVELNLRAARKRQSPQTGFIHYCYEADSERHDTIPLFENFCFVLALLRSRQSENMLEALALLHRLVAFEKEGNFSVYLHEFPLCKDRMQALRLLPLFHAIETDFCTILDSSLQSLLQQLIARILSHYQAQEEELPMRYKALLNAYVQPAAFELIQFAKVEQMGEALIAARMAYTRGISTRAITEAILKNGHAEFLTYMGPQEQQKAEPKPTLFDFFLCDYHRKYPTRLLTDHPIHLRASLVYPLEKVEFERESRVPFQSISPHPRQPYTLYWGSADSLHSLVCDPKETRYEIESMAQGARITFMLMPSSSLEESIEIAFFCNLHPAHTFLISGQRSIVFQLGQAIEIYTQNDRSVFKCTLTFTLLEGSGVFLGHLSRGNRPLQISAKGALRYEAYDWQISLRTVRRIEPCILCASIKWEQFASDCSTMPVNPQQDP